MPAMTKKQSQPPITNEQIKAIETPQADRTPTKAADIPKTEPVTNKNINSEEKNKKKVEESLATELQLQPLKIDATEFT